MVLMKILKKFHKYLLLLALLLMGVAVAKFMVPKKSDREAAVGAISGLPTEMKEAYTNTGEFDAIPDPGPGD